MGRLSPDKVSGAHDNAPRRGLVARVLPLVGVAIGAAVMLSGCGSTQPYSTISPATDKAQQIQDLYTFVFIAAAIVFVGVQAAIIYTVMRFRERGGPRPPQTHGNRTLEFLWTAIPTAIMLVVFLRSASTIFDFARAEEVTPDTMVVDVYGKQWWWEVHYPQLPGEKDGEPLITANEIRLPVNKHVVFNLRSNNVIHSFSVPRLSGKTDVVPGHDNKLAFTTREVGEYWGECAEFCGAAHAWMRFKVLVVPQEEFDAWVAAWHTPPAFDANPSTADAHEPPAAFITCAVCHRITGTPEYGLVGVGLAADPFSQSAGPNLTLLGCRDFIAAGVLKNTPEDLRTWITHTDTVKQGVYMPNYYTGRNIDGSAMGSTLTDQQVDEIVQYLGSLVPDSGTCPSADLSITGGETDTAAAATTE